MLDQELKIQIPSLEPQSTQKSGDSIGKRQRAEECGELKGK